ITRVEPGSAVEREGVRPGMQIVTLDMHAMSDWIRAGQGTSDRERSYDVWRRVYRALHGPAGSVVSLHLMTTTDQERTVRLTRVPDVGQIVRVGNLPPLRVIVETREVQTPAHRRAGFIGFNYWMTAINGPVEAAVDRFRQSDGLVFDLRGNPGGL